MAFTTNNSQGEFDLLRIELSLIEDILVSSPTAEKSIESCLERCQSLISQFLGAEFAQAWQYESARGKTPRLEYVPHLFVGDDVKARQLIKESKKVVDAHSTEFPSRALANQSVVYIDDLTNALDDARIDTMIDAGIKGVVLLSVTTSEHSYILEFAIQKARTLDESALKFLRRLADIISNFLTLSPVCTGNIFEESEYRILLDAVPAMVWYKDRHNRILNLNKHAAEVSGRSVDEVIGKRTEEIYPDDAAKYYLDDMAVISSGKPKRRILEALHGADGEVTWVSTDKIPYMRNGRVEGIIVFSTDISELKRAEDELRKIQFELESAVEERNQELATVNIFFTLSRELLCIANTQGYFTHLNPIWTERLGFTLEELYSRPYVDFVHEEDRFKTSEIQKELNDIGEVSNFENRYLTKDGAFRWFRWSAIAVGESVYAVAYDITDRKKVEQELIDANERFIDIGKHMPGMIYQFCIDTDGKPSFPYLSEGCAELLGHESHEIQANAMLAFEVMHPDDARGIMEGSLHAAKHLTKFQYEGRVLSADGSVRYIRATSTPERLENGDVLFNGLVMDITDLKLAQEEVRKLNRDLEERNENLTKINSELESMTQKWEHAYDRALEASKLKSEFVANISHEIRTPLSAVIGTSDLLLDTSLDSQQREYASAARDSAKSLLTIINDILDFSKIEAGKIDLENIDFELQQIVESSIDFFIKDSTGKKLSILTYVDPTLPRLVNGDPVRIRQVLINLVSNAVKFTSFGEVVVRVVRSVGSRGNQPGGRIHCVRFEVRDTGIGMPESVRQRLFTPFVQADGSTTRRFGGTGLGLSICKRLVELMDGEIGYESVEGEGSNFWFNISLPSAQYVAQLPTVSPLKGQVIFVYGGSDSTKSVVSSYLEAEGYQLNLATSLGGMLYSLDQVANEGATVHSIIVDGSQASKDPINVVDAIRRDARYKKTNLIFLADLHQRDEGELACERGADLCVYKPFRKTELLSAVFFGKSASNLAASVTGARPGAKRKVTEKIRILVVEDNNLMRGLTIKQLEKFGIETDFATNGAEAVEKTYSNEYSLVLMDCQMPVMDGFEATLEIRKREFAKGGHVPIIAMTAFAMAGDREQCIASGMDDYLSKPVTMEQLEGMLEKWLEEVFSPAMLLLHAETGRSSSVQQSVEESVEKKEKRVVEKTVIKPVKKTEATTARKNNKNAAKGDTADDGTKGRDRSLLDIDKVVEYYGQNCLHEILSSFIEELDDLVSAIVNEVKRGNHESVARLAHQLKGLVSVLSANELSELAVKLEMACDERRDAEVKTQTAEMVRSKKDLVNFINNFLSTN
jgi:PAS domain S-box-containing protein